MIGHEPGAARCEVTDAGACITCGDVAVELEVVEIDVARGLALCCDSGGRRETVETALVEPVETGARLLVHAGTAIARAAPAEPRAPGRKSGERRPPSRDPRRETAQRGGARGDAVVERSP